MDTAEVTRQGCTSDLQQLKALLWRQQLLKRRSWPNTLVELLSPVFLIFLLVIAYHKVHETHHDARIYVNDTSQVLRNMTDALLTAQETTLASSTNCTAVLAGLNITSSTAQAADASGWAPGLTPAQQQAVQDCLQRGSFASDALPMAVIQALQAFIDTKGPIPIPTLDEFVVLHEAIQLAVGQNTEVLDLLHGAKRSFGWNVLGNLLDLGQLAFAPATPDVLRFAAHMERTHEMFSKVFRGVFATEAEAEDYVLNGGQRVWALVVFNEGPNATVADYTVRMNYTTVPTTSIAVNKWKHGVPVYYKQYLTSGFLSIQAAIDGYVLGQSHLHEASLGPLPVQPSDDPSANSWVEWGAVFPTAAYHHNRFYDAVGPMLGLLMCLCMVFPLSMLVRGVVEEKETRARETMMIMGLRPWVLSTAWALTYGVIFCFVAASVTLTCCLSFLPSTSPGLLFTLLLAFSASELAFGLMVASIFSNAKIAGIVAPLAHFAALMPRYIFFRAEEQQAIGGKAAVSLLGPAAFTFAADLLAQYEGSGSGMGWGDLWADAYSLGAVLCMLSLDTLLYAVLAWYLEKVLPSQYGPRLPLWFPFSGSYWRSGDLYEDEEAAMVGSSTAGAAHSGRAGALGSLQRWWQRLRGQQGAVRYRQVHADQATTDDEEAALNPTASSAQLGQSNSDAEQKGEPASHSEEAVVVELHNLRKVYGKHIAVKGLSLKMRNHEITSLLGPNGAGKTSAVGMLSGLLRPSAGDALILGYSVLREPGHARQYLGYCPQQNVQFGQLTVGEHLLLYAAVKRIPGGAFGGPAAAAAQEIMEAVGLAEKKHCYAQALSGGMKRKLQVAIALLGGSKVVLLDEPTSGVDPVSRRALWTVLENAKQDRAMLLTTHYMDEADLLSDQVAIMAEGELQCFGPSLQLKQQYSDGYTLCMTTSLEGQVHREGIQQLITSHVPKATFLRTSGAELVYRLPMGATAAFPDMLEQLDADQPKLGVVHYGLSMPTLEEVFLRCTSRQEVRRHAQRAQHAEHAATTTSRSSVSAHPPAHAQSSAGAAGPSSVEMQVSKGMMVVGQPTGWVAARDHQGSASASASAPASSTPARASKAVQADSSTLQSAAGAASDIGPETPPAMSEAAHHSGFSPSTSQPGSPQLPDQAESSSSGRADTAALPSTSRAGSSNLDSTDLVQEPIQPGDEDPDQPGGTGSHGRLAAMGMYARAFRQMFKKRALIASRDKKNMMFTLLLPVVAIAFVLLILRVNINPSAPTMNLTLGSLGQRSPIPIANAPGALSGCISLDGSPHSTDPSCAPGWAFQSVEDVADSYAMSEQLLRGLAAGVPAQYGALVFNDTIVQRMADDSGLSALSSDQLIAQLMPLIVGQLGTLLPGLAGVDSAAAVSGMTLDQQKQAAAAAAALELVMLPEARVLRRMYQRHTQQLPVMLMHNASSYHSLPSLVSDLHATIGALNAAPGGIKPRFNARSHPLPLTEEESVQLDNILLVLAALFVLVPFCYLSGAYCINPVIERTSQALHMQLLSGCPTVIYWLGSYTWDLLMHSFVCLLSLAIFAAYQDDALVGDANRALGTLALLLAYGAAVIPLSYCYSFGFSSPSAAQVAIAGLNFVTGFVFLTASYVMEAIPETRAAQRVLVHICRLMPSFNLGEGFIEMTRLTLELGLVQARTAADTTNSTDSQFTMSGAVANVTAALGVPLQAGSPTQTPTATAAAALAENWQPGSAFDWDVLGRSLTFMCIEAVAFFTLAVALDWSSRHSLADGPLRALLRCWQSALSVLVPAPVARWCRERGFRHRGVAGQGYELAGAAGSLGGNNKETEMAGMAGEAAAPRKLPRGYQVDLGDDDDWAQPASSSIDIHELEASQGVTGGQGVEDADVEVERQRVQQGRADAETICIRNLQKVYGGRPPKVAVHDLCLGVPSGQRFGFLGPNGAGKTTTLSILSGSLLPSSGDALVNGASVIHDRSRAGGLLGYCPQVDPLVDKMTAVEQLAMYARLKGVPEKKINSAVADVVRRVSLPAEMALRCAADYSGGNKRKLALGMALVGSPAAILLDECSSGMDPSARRAMWSFIINATSTPEEQAAGGGAPAGHLAMGGRRTAAVSVVLTTHSMEECEALCTRVGIMHKGRLACVGSPQRLKALYGGGYLLEVLTAEGDAMSHARVKEFVTQQFGGAETGAADGVHQVGRAQYQLRHGGPSLAVVMREVEEVKEALGIRAYSISQPTLEQVFLAVIGERLHGE